MKATLRVGPASHIPAHESIATVAPFRAWRGLQSIVAGGPAGTHSERARIIHDLKPNEKPFIQLRTD